LFASLSLIRFESILVGIIHITPKFKQINTYAHHLTLSSLNKQVKLIS